jgi:ATP-grasp ribosomal peptide maturase
MMDTPVLILTGIDDPTSDAVIDELNGRGVPVVRLDPAGVLTGEVEVSAHYADGQPSRLSTSSRELDLGSVRSVYYRRPSPYKASAAMSEDDGRFAVEQARHGMGGLLANIEARWVNHMWRSLAADFKPTQLSVAVNVGLEVPPSLVTNSLDEARAFAKAQGSVVYKPLYASDLHAPDGTPSFIWVGQVDPDEMDAGIRSTLHLFQATVQKVADVRTTMIGGKAFSVRVDSPHLDWRRDYDLVTYTVVDTPSQVVEGCRRYLDHFGLVFGAFDFGIRDDGGWAWYECNTGGQWHWLEQETGLPMTSAIADLLEMK